MVYKIPAGKSPIYGAAKNVSIKIQVRRYDRFPVLREKRARPGDPKRADEDVPRRPDRQRDPAERALFEGSARAERRFPVWRERLRTGPRIRRQLSNPVDAESGLFIFISTRRCCEST